MCLKNKSNLSVEFCGVRFAHPFILAAAPPTDELEMVRDAFEAGWAGAVLKTTSIPGTKVDLAYPMMCGMDMGRERLAGLGNVDLISKYHIDTVEDRIRALKKEFADKVVIASISGVDKLSWQEVAKRAQDAGADMVEASFSCPQGSMGLKAGSMLGQDEKASAEVAGWIREAANSVPVIIKLTPQVSDIAGIAIAVKSAGVDAVCVGNTIPALMGVDIETGVPIPDVYGKSTYSGLSGPAVKPISLRCVAEVAKRTGMQIAASGGASSWKDAMEFMMLGAGIVQFCTAVMHRGFGIIDALKDGFQSHLDRKRIVSARDVIGLALPNIVSHDELDSSRGPRGCRPHVDQAKCVKCGACVIACRDGAHRAIEQDADGLPQIDDNRCVGCALCAAVCPVHCIEMGKRK